jgi:hypothetical protein
MQYYKLILIQFVCNKNLLYGKKQGFWSRSTAPKNRSLQCHQRPSHTASSRERQPPWTWRRLSLIKSAPYTNITVIISSVSWYVPITYHVCYIHKVYICSVFYYISRYMSCILVCMYLLHTMYLI